MPLPARLNLSALAWQSVTAAGAAISQNGCGAPDPQRIAAAYRSDRHLLIDGVAPDVWAPLSRFWRTADGWVRTHGNYRHHAAALCSGLSLADDAHADEVGARLLTLHSAEACTAITAAGGLCVPVRDEDPHRDVALRRLPLVEVERLGNAPARALPHRTDTHPFSGVRVLDLTRVIAGPVATRTLAFAGADVLRIDPPAHPEFSWQHLDTGHGKRSALLDISAQPALLQQLLRDADVVVLGYRPEGLRRLGLFRERLAAQHPHLVIAQLSAWPGDHSPRGFDSLVQAECGIARIESVDGDTPGALPAQGLDHSAGYLLAAGIADALHRRAADGGTWSVRTSLRRVAAELLGMPRGAGAALPAPPADPVTQEFDVAEHRVTTVAPAVTWPGALDAYQPPREWGADRPGW